MAAAPPDMEITAYDIEKKAGAKIGVGWTQDDGSISLVLNPGCALIPMPHLRFKVKPRGVDTSGGMPLASETPPKQKAGAFLKKSPAPPAKYHDDMDDDIPF